MRLGELLLNASIINQKQLSDGLAYAKSKAIPIGRVLKLLRFIEEEDLKAALRVQELIRQGLRSELAIPLLTRVGKEKVSVDRALIDLINILHVNSNGKSSEPAAEAPATPATPVTPVASLVAPAAPVRASLSPSDLVKEGDLKLAEDKCSEAEKLYQQAREQSEGLFGTGNLETTGPLLKLAHLYLVTDRFVEAESLYMQILQVKQQSFGEQHPAVAQALEDIADLYIAREEHDRARQFLQISIMIREPSLPKEIDAFLGTLKRLNIVLQKRGVEVDPNKRMRLGELLTEAGLVGSAQLQQALQQSRAYGIPLGSVLQENGMVSARDLKSVLNAQFAIKEAQLPEQIAVKALKAAYMKGVAFKELIAVAGLVSPEGQDEASARLILEQERLLSLEMEHGPEAVIVARAVLELAEQYASRGSLAEAEGLFRRGIGVLRRHAEHAADADQAAHRLAQLYISHERYSQAEPLLLETLQSRTASGETESIESFVCLKDLARLAHLQDSSPIASGFLKSAVSVLLSLQGQYLVSLEDLRWMLVCLHEARQGDLAKQLLQNQLAQCEKSKGNNLDTAKIHEEAGDFFFNTEDRAEAKVHYRKAMLAYRQHLSPSDPSTTRVAEKLSQCAI